MWPSAGPDPTPITAPYRPATALGEPRGDHWQADVAERNDDQKERAQRRAPFRITKGTTVACAISADTQINSTAASEPANPGERELILNQLRRSDRPAACPIIPCGDPLRTMRLGGDDRHDPVPTDHRPMSRNAK